MVNKLVLDRRAHKRSAASPQTRAFTPGPQAGSGHLLGPLGGPAGAGRELEDLATEPDLPSGIGSLRV